MKQSWRIDGGGTTLVAVSDKGALPEVVYFGPGLEQGANLDQLADLSRTPHAHGQLDQPPSLSILPESGRGFTGQPGLIGYRLDGTGWVTQFHLGDQTSCSATRLIVVAEDEVAGLRYRAELSLDPDTGVLTARASLANIGPDRYALSWLACPVLPASRQSEHMIGFHGRWCAEFQMQNVPWAFGAHVRENRLGRTSHEHFPGLFVPETGTDELTGLATGWHLAWSGDHRLVAEQLPNGQRQVQFGVLLAPGEAALEPGESIETPALITATSDRGLNGVSQAFHAHCRTRILPDVAWYRDRPVHYNCWESVYFDHDVETLKAIATSVCELGAELFVLDDGWFAGRRHARAGLGDWTPDPDLYPDGLEPLIDHVRCLGMRFGLWVEPEMVNPDSDLYRAHPDWALDLEGYTQILGRHQMILDLSRAEVRGYLFESLAALLSAHPIDYLKWDMNRTAQLAAMGNGQAVGRRQQQGLFALLDQVRAAFPEIVIESCASGGGRADFEMLKRTSRIWTSDQNDAHERALIHRGASYVFPPEILGAHVGAKVSHTSGRALSMNFRAPIMACRHMGLEMDPRALGEDERAVLKRWVERYKGWRGWLGSARQYRLPDPDPNRVVDLFLSETADRFVLCAAQLAVQAAASAAPIRLSMLDEGAAYRLTLLDPETISEAVNHKVEVGPELRGGRAVTGEMLARSGISLPNAQRDQILVIEAMRIGA